MDVEPNLKVIALSPRASEPIPPERIAETLKRLRLLAEHERACTRGAARAARAVTQSAARTRA